MLKGRLKACMGVLVGSAMALLYALPCSADGSSDLAEMQRELRALRAEMESLRADLNAGKEELKVQNEELLASKREFSQLSEQVRGLRQANPEEVETLKDQIKRELGIIPNVYNDLSRKIRIGFNSRTRFEYSQGMSQITAQGNAGPFSKVAGGSWFGNPGGRESSDREIVQQRTRLNIDADVHEHLRAFFQLQDSRFWGIEGDTGGANAQLQGGAGFDNQNTLDMHQGYVDIRKLFDWPLTVRVGRQEIIWGAKGPGAFGHRIMGNFGWDNIANSWDGVRAMWDTESYRAEAFAVIRNHDPRYKERIFDDFGHIIFFSNVLKEPLFFTGEEIFTFDDIFFGGVLPSQGGDFDSDWRLYGGMLTLKKLIPNATLELMYLTDQDQADRWSLETWSDDDDDEWIDVDEFHSGNLRVHDVGFRIVGKIGRPVDYFAEYHEQFGDYRGQAHRARAGVIGAGYTFTEVAWEPRLGLEFNWSPGDGNGPKGKHKTFHNFYPTNHAQYGYMDMMAWKNMKGLRGQIKVKPTKKLVTWVDIWSFWIDNVNDAWYNAGQAILRGFTGPSISSTEPDDHLGVEIDLTAKYKLYKNVALQAGYSHFFAGEYIEDTGRNGSDEAWVGARDESGDVDSNWAYLQLTVGF